jgi:hypothetical protein
LTRGADANLTNVFPLSRQTVLVGAEQHSQEVDDASAKLEARAEPIYHPVWGKHADE